MTKKIGQKEIKYIPDFNFRYLRILNLSNNSINSQGALFLSKSKLISLRTLNLNYNEIGDEGLKHISNALFCSLNNLYLFNNNLSSKGIKDLVKSEFANNLIILTLSENGKIGDIGVSYIKEHKGWYKLTKLNLDFTGLTDISLDYIGRSSMPRLEKLNIQGNKFTNNVKKLINTLRENLIHVNCRTEYERTRKKKK